MRYRCNVPDRHNTNSCLCDRSDRRFSAPAGSLYPDLHLAHSRFRGFPCRVARRLLSSERRALSRTTKTLCTTRRLSYEISVSICDRDQSVIERCRYIYDAYRNILLLFLLVGLLFRCWFCCHKIQWSVVSGSVISWLYSNGLRLLPTLLFTGRLFLSDRGFARSFPGSGVRACTLPTHRQTASMTKTGPR